MLIRKKTLLGFAALAFAWGGLASAQAWPDKTVRYIVPYSAGGTTDELARVVTNGLKLGQPVVVDNKPGQGGASAWRNSREARTTATPSAAGR